jgi:hypothetical protein
MFFRTPHIVLTLAASVVSIGCFGANSFDAGKTAALQSVPVYSAAEIGRIGFFYAGGHSVGEPDKEIMDGTEYVEVILPRKMRRAYPIPCLHGTGQTGTDWLQTLNGRAGWAYYFLKHGYVVYMVDPPARGRSAYVPGADGPLTIPTAPQLERLWTVLAEMGSDAPNEGKMGESGLRCIRNNAGPICAGNHAG